MRFSWSASSRTTAGERSPRSSSELASDLGVELVVTLGALLADVPHTRPAPVTGAATDPKLVDELGLQLSRYEGPTGIVGVLLDACRRSGIPSVSLWAAVPHYVSLAPSPRAARALCDRLATVLGIAIDVERARGSRGVVRRAGLTGRRERLPRRPPMSRSSSSAPTRSTGSRSPGESRPARRLPPRSRASSASVSETAAEVPAPATSGGSGRVLGRLFDRDMRWLVRGRIRWRAVGHRRLASILLWLVQTCA